jgi:hypothetical protein
MSKAKVMKLRVKSGGKQSPGYFKQPCATRRMSGRRVIGHKAVPGTGGNYFGSTWKD